MPQQLKTSFALFQLVVSKIYLMKLLIFILELFYFRYLVFRHIINWSLISAFFYYAYDHCRHCCGVNHYDRDLHVQQKCVQRIHFCLQGLFLLSMVHMLQHSCILQVRFVDHNQFQNLQCLLDTNGHPFRKLKVHHHLPIM